MEFVYYDRIKYSFPDEDDKNVQHNYMCKKGKTEKNTDKRAVKTHHYMMNEMNRITQEYINTPSFIDDGGDTLYGDALKKMEDGIEKLTTDIEEQFKCMYTGKS